MTRLSLPPVDQDRPTQGPAHAWVVCLAIVVTGLSVVAALLSPRGGGGSGGQATVTRTPTVVVSPGSPPKTT